MVTIPVVLTIIITFFSPFVVALINRVHWNTETKNLIAIAVSAAIAVVYFIMTGGVDWGNLAIAIPAVYGLQQALYNFILHTFTSKIEALTDPTVKAAVVDNTEQLPGDVTVADSITVVSPQVPVQAQRVLDAKNQEPPIGPVVKG